MESSARPDLSRISVIQGGMGIGVSHWKLARAVAAQGQLGVVSGTALNSVLVRRLQGGDPEGHLRRAFAHCPLRAAADRIWARYFIPGGKAPTEPYRLAPLFSLTPGEDLVLLTIVANFVEIFLAKEGHAGMVGINLLEKIQLPTLPSLFGAMLAGVDCVLMGAGIPRAIPGVLDQFARGEKAQMRIFVEGAAPSTSADLSELDPADFLPDAQRTLRRPLFLAIVSSSTLATTLARKASGRVDGFVVEGFTAGGHNAPPRGTVTLSERGSPIYGPRDIPDLSAVRALGLPFWLAGSYASPQKLAEAKALGAQGVQIGTAFAFCAESGLDAELKNRAIQKSIAGEIEVQTDGRASPTGLPFKVVQMEGSVSDATTYRERGRDCDLGYLRQPYMRGDGTVGYRCAAEPEAEFTRKGGDAAETAGRKCLCNGLFAAAGLGQALPGGAIEPPILTAGEDVAHLRQFLPAGSSSYSAADVLRYLLSDEA